MREREREIEREREEGWREEGERGIKITNGKVHEILERE